MSFDLRRQLAGREVIFLSLTFSKVTTSQFPFFFPKTGSLFIPFTKVILFTKAFMNSQAGWEKFSFIRSSVHS